MANSPLLPPKVNNEAIAEILDRLTEQQIRYPVGHGAEG